MKRTRLFNEKDTVEQGVVLAHTGKGFNSFFAALEKLKAERQAQDNVQSLKG